MTTEDAIAEALELVVEEPTSLFELVWRLQTLEVPEAERRPLAEAAARALLAEGFATLVRRRGERGPQAPVTRADAERAIASADSWDEPAGRAADQLLLVATPAGIEAFQGR